MERDKEPDSQADDVQQEPLLPSLSGWFTSAVRQLGRLGYTVELTEAELEQRLAPRFPWTGRKWGLSLTLKAPRLKILADGDLRLRLALTVSNSTFQGEGGVQLRGRLHYDADSGGFFIADVHIEQLELAGWQRPLWPIRKLLEPALAWYFQNNPVVELQPERRGHALMKAVLERIETDSGFLRLHLRLLRTGH